MGMGQRNKNLFKTLALLVAIVGLTGCQEKNDRVGVAVTGPRAQSPVNTSDLSLQGRVYSDASYQQKFQEAVAGLLSTDVRPEYIGVVSANGQNNSGVFFGGQITLTSGSIMNGMGGTIANTSRLVIQVRDFAPQHPNAPLLPAVRLSNAQGSINGNYAEIVFSDAYGSVALQGYIDSVQRTFVGVMSYDNQVLYDGSRPGAAGTLGNFTIPLCSFFVCN